MFPQNCDPVGLTLVVAVDARDVSNISRVEFYLRNVLVSTAYATPYQWSWDTTKYPNAEYIIEIRAYDALGNMKSQNVTVRVNNIEAVVPWWQENLWAIIQAAIGLGALLLGIISYWSRTKERRRKKEETKKETTHSVAEGTNTA